MGDLKAEVERALTARLDEDDPPDNRNGVSWQDWVKPRLTTSFLSADEKATMRGRLERIRQRSNEDIMSFHRRFNQIARVAYPDVAGAPRNAEVHGILINLYGRGLRSDRMARKLADRDPPFPTINAAMAHIETLTAGRERYERMMRPKDDPKEVGAVKAGKSSGESVAFVEEAASLREDIRKMSRELSRLCNTVAARKGDVKKQREQVAAGITGDYYQPAGQPQYVALVNPPRGRGKRKSGPPRNSNQNRGRNRGNRGGRGGNDRSGPVPRDPDSGVCYGCGKPGHYVRDCRSRKGGSSNYRARGR